MARYVGLFALVTVLGVVAGCSSSDPEVAQMSGTVTFKGQPVPAGYISFTPDLGQKGEVRVVQIKDGRYDSFQEPTPGIFPGPCTVRIAGYNGKPETLFPQGKQIFNTYTFTDTVPGGTTTKDFTVPDKYGQKVLVTPTADPPEGM